MRTWAMLDSGTRAWWRLVGRPVDLSGRHDWLRAPTAGAGEVRDGWLDAEARLLGGAVQRGRLDAGLLPRMSALDGPGFRAADLQSQVRDFYTRTGAWHMDVWSQWNAPFAVPGALISRLFGRRVQQLALPVRPLEVAYGMDSEVAPIIDAEGTQVAAGWLRTLRSTGSYVFSGCYSVQTLPRATRPSVRVTFPLESGNVQVYLRPFVRPDGSLLLSSGPGAFGTDGTYVVVRHGGRDHAARVPLHETFHVFVDADGQLRTDHRLSVFSSQAVHLHYRLTPTDQSRSAGQDALDAHRSR